MKPSPCLLSSTATLKRVLIGNATLSEISRHLQRWVLVSDTAAPAVFTKLPRRHVSSTPTRHDEGFVSRSLFQGPRVSATKIKFGAGYQLRDEEIRYPFVCLKLPASEGGGITEPESTTRILKRINRETHSLLLRVGPDPEQDRPHAICEIVDKKAEYKAMVEKKKKQKEEKAKKVVKELEINWAITPHDLSIKLKQLKNFLNKGYRVDLKLSGQTKKSKKKATLAEMKEVMQSVEEAIANIEGTKHYKPTEGVVGQSGTVAMHLAGSKTEASKESESTEPPSDVPSEAPSDVPPEGETQNA